jgi:predicted enzyme related to lactoylglutathione lyase
MSGRVVHFEMPYDDGDRAAAFYGEVFGWEIQRMPEDFGGYILVSTGPTGEQGPTEPGFIDGGLGPRDSSVGGPNIVIDVADIEATLQQVQQRGGSLVSGRAAVGEMGFAAYFTDPEGNLVGLWENAPAQGGGSAPDHQV